MSDLMKRKEGENGSIEGHIKRRKEDISQAFVVFYEFVKGKKQKIKGLRDLQLKILSTKSNEEFDQLKEEYRQFFITKNRLQIEACNIDYFKNLVR